MAPSDPLSPSGLHNPSRLAASADALRLRRTLQTTGAVGVAGDSAKRDSTLELLRMSQASLMRIPDEHVPAFAELCVLRNVPQGTVLQRAGQVAKAMWIVADGELCERTPGERSHVVSQIRRNQTAGLSQVLCQAAALLEVTAVLPSEVLEINVDRLAQMRAVYHPMALLISEAFLSEAVMALHGLHSRLSHLAALRGRPIPLDGQLPAHKSDDLPFVPRR